MSRTQAELLERARGRGRRALRRPPARAWAGQGAWDNSALRCRPPPLTLADFDFALPPELIAQHPAPERSGSRLLDGSGAEPVDRRLPRAAGAAAPGRPARRQRHPGREGAPARRQGERRRGRGAGRAGRAGPTRPGPRAGEQAAASGQQAALRRRVRRRGRSAAAGRDGSLFVLRFPDEPYALLERHGHVPLPPYIRHADDARRRGALPDRVRRPRRRRRRADGGAPFRRSRCSPCWQRSASQRTAITLPRRRRHLPAGAQATISPATSCTASATRSAIDAVEAIVAARARGGRVVAVGTTSLRALEAAALRVPRRQRPGAGARRDRPLHHARLRLSCRRPPAHQLPSAQEHPADAGLRLSPATSASGRSTATRSPARYRFFSYGDAMLLAREDAVHGG